MATRRLSDKLVSGEITSIRKGPGTGVEREVLVNADLFGDATAQAPIYISENQVKTIGTGQDFATVLDAVLWFNRLRSVTPVGSSGGGRLAEAPTVTFNLTAETHLVDTNAYGDGKLTVINNPEIRLEFKGVSMATSIIECVGTHNIIIGQMYWANFQDLTTKGHWTFRNIDNLNFGYSWNTSSGEWQHDLNAAGEGRFWVENCSGSTKCANDGDQSITAIYVYCYNKNSSSFYFTHNTIATGYSFCMGAVSFSGTHTSPRHYGRRGRQNFFGNVICDWFIISESCSLRMEGTTNQISRFECVEDASIVVTGTTNIIPTGSQGVPYIENLDNSSVDFQGPVVLTVINNSRHGVDLRHSSRARFSDLTINDVKTGKNGINVSNSAKCHCDSLTITLDGGEECNVPYGEIQPSGAVVYDGVTAVSPENWIYEDTTKTVGPTGDFASLVDAFNWYSLQRAGAILLSGTGLAYNTPRITLLLEDGIHTPSTVWGQLRITGGECQLDIKGTSTLGTILDLSTSDDLMFSGMGGISVRIDKMTIKSGTIATRQGCKINLGINNELLMVDEPRVYVWGEGSKCLMRTITGPFKLYIDEGGHAACTDVSLNLSTLSVTNKGHFDNYSGSNTHVFAGPVTVKNAGSITSIGVDPSSTGLITVESGGMVQMVGLPASSMTTSVPIGVVQPDGGVIYDGVTVPSAGKEILSAHTYKSIGVGMDFETVEEAVEWVNSVDVIGYVDDDIYGTGFGLPHVRFDMMDATHILTKDVRLENRGFRIIFAGQGSAGTVFSGPFKFRMTNCELVHFDKMDIEQIVFRASTTYLNMGGIQYGYEEYNDGVDGPGTADLTLSGQVSVIGSETSLVAILGSLLDVKDLHMFDNSTAYIYPNDLSQPHELLSWNIDKLYVQDTSTMWCENWGAADQDMNINYILVQGNSFLDIGVARDLIFGNMDAYHGCSVQLDAGWHTSGAVKSDRSQYATRPNIQSINGSSIIIHAALETSGILDADLWALQADSGTITYENGHTHTGLGQESKTPIGEITDAGGGVYAPGTDTRDTTILTEDTVITVGAGQDYETLQEALEFCNTRYGRGSGADAGYSTAWTPHAPRVQIQLTAGTHTVTENIAIQAGNYRLHFLGDSAATTTIEGDYTLSFVGVYQVDMDQLTLNCKIRLGTIPAPCALGWLDFELGTLFSMEAWGGTWVALYDYAANPVVRDISALTGAYIDWDHQYAAAGIATCRIVNVYENGSVRMQGFDLQDLVVDSIAVTGGVCQLKYDDVTFKSIGADKGGALACENSGYAQATPLVMTKVAGVPASVYYEDGFVSAQGGGSVTIDGSVVFADLDDAAKYGVHVKTKGEVSVNGGFTFPATPTATLGNSNVTIGTRQLDGSVIFDGVTASQPDATFLTEDLVITVGATGDVATINEAFRIAENCKVGATVYDPPNPDTGAPGGWKIPTVIIDLEEQVHDIYPDDPDNGWYARCQNMQCRLWLRGQDPEKFETTIVRTRGCSMKFNWIEWCSVSDFSMMGTIDVEFVNTFVTYGSWREGRGPIKMLLHDDPDATGYESTGFWVSGNDRCNIQVHSDSYMDAVECWGGVCSLSLVVGDKDYVKGTLNMPECAVRCTKGNMTINVFSDATNTKLTPATLKSIQTTDHGSISLYSSGEAFLKVNHIAQYNQGHITGRHNPNFNVETSWIYGREGSSFDVEGKFDILPTVGTTNKGKIEFNTGSKCMINTLGSSIEAWTAHNCVYAESNAQIRLGINWTLTSATDIDVLRASNGGVVQIDNPTVNLLGTAELGQSEVGYVHPDGAVIYDGVTPIRAGNTAILAVAKTVGVGQDFTTLEEAMDWVNKQQPGSGNSASGSPYGGYYPTRITLTLTDALYTLTRQVTCTYSGNIYINGQGSASTTIAGGGVWDFAFRTCAYVQLENLTINSHEFAVQGVTHMRIGADVVIDVTGQLNFLRCHFYTVAGSSLACDGYMNIFDCYINIIADSIDVDGAYVYIEKTSGSITTGLFDAAGILYVRQSCDLRVDIDVLNVGDDMIISGTSGWHESNPAHQVNIGGYLLLTDQGNVSLPITDVTEYIKAYDSAHLKFEAALTVGQYIEITGSKLETSSAVDALGSIRLRQASSMYFGQPVTCSYLSVYGQSVIHFNNTLALAATVYDSAVWMVVREGSRCFIGSNLTITSPTLNGMLSELGGEIKCGGSVTITLVPTSQYGVRAQTGGTIKLNGAPNITLNGGTASLPGTYSQIQRNGSVIWDGVTQGTFA